MESQIFELQYALDTFYFLFIVFLFASFCLALLWIPMLGGRPKAVPLPFMEAAEGRLLYGGWGGSKYSKNRS